MVILQIENISYDSLGQIVPLRKSQSNVSCIPLSFLWTVLADVENLCNSLSSANQTGMDMTGGQIPSYL